MSNAGRPLSLLERLIVASFNVVWRLLKGYDNAFTSEVMRTFGIRGFFRWFKTMAGIISALTKEWGQPMAEQLMGFAGMWNGCRYCSIGHNRAANLMYFRDRGLLFPIDELEIPDLQMCSDSEIMALMKERFASGEFELEARLIQRQFELRAVTAEELGDSHEDKLLHASLMGWEWMNECTIPATYDMDPASIPAFTRINLDRPLYERYRSARSQERLS